MGLKKVSVKNSGEKLKCMILLEVKWEIVKTHEEDVQVMDLVRQYEHSISITNKKLYKD